MRRAGCKWGYILTSSANKDSDPTESNISNTGRMCGIPFDGVADSCREKDEETHYIDAELAVICDFDGTVFHLCSSSAM